MKRRLATTLLAGLLSLLTAPLYAMLTGDEVVVVFNKKLPASEDVARHYALVRKVPADQVFGLDLSTNEEISRDEYERTLEKPLARELESRKLWRIGKQTWPIGGSNDLREVRVPVQSRIRYVLFCYGVPLKIAHDSELKEPGLDRVKPELRFNGAAVDSEIAALPLPPEVRTRFGLLRNINYTTTNSLVLSPTNGILLVARLDGPTPEIARGLVDKALAAETNGFWGRVYCDSRSTTDTNYMIGDQWMLGAYEICQLLGYDGVVDTNATTFPAGQPMSHVIFYAGWYDAMPSGPFLAPKIEFMPGAFAYHLHSGNAWTIRQPNQTWASTLLAKGATCTFGSVNEPYLHGTTDVGTFTARWLLTGMTFGEAAYAAQSCVSWQTTVVGDPLYRPFAFNPQLLHAKLERSENKLIEWSHVRVVNLNLLKGTPVYSLIDYLEQIPLTKESAVMTEKLADLFAAVGKPASAILTYERALKLECSPQHKLRLYLKLAGRQTMQKEPQAAIETYRKLLQDFPEYPGKPDIETQINKLNTATAPATNGTTEAKAPAEPARSPSSTNAAH